MDSRNASAAANDEATLLGSTGVGAAPLYSYVPNGPSLSMKDFALRWAVRAGVTYHDYVNPEMLSKSEESAKKGSAHSLSSSTHHQEVSSDSYEIKLEHRPWSDLRTYLQLSLAREEEAVEREIAMAKASAERLQQRREAELRAGRELGMNSLTVDATSAPRTSSQKIGGLFQPATGATSASRVVVIDAASDPLSKKRDFAGFANTTAAAASRDEQMSSLNNAAATAIGSPSLIIGSVALKTAIQALVGGEEEAENEADDVTATTSANPTLGKARRNEALLLGEKAGSSASGSEDFLSTTALLHAVGTGLLSVASQVHKHSTRKRAEEALQQQRLKGECEVGARNSALNIDVGASAAAATVTPELIRSYFSTKLLFEGSPPDNILFGSLVETESALAEKFLEEKTAFGGSQPPDNKRVADENNNINKNNNANDREGTVARSGRLHNESGHTLSGNTQHSPSSRKVHIQQMSPLSTDDNTTNTNAKALAVQSTTKLYEALGSIFSRSIGTEFENYMKALRTVAEEAAAARPTPNSSNNGVYGDRFLSSKHDASSPLALSTRPAYCEFLRSFAESISPSPSLHHFASNGYFTKLVRAHSSSTSFPLSSAFSSSSPTLDLKMAAPAKGLRTVGLSTASVSSTFLVCSHISLALLRRVALSVIVLTGHGGGGAVGSSDEDGGDFSQSKATAAALLTLDETAAGVSSAASEFLARQSALMLMRAAQSTKAEVQLKKASSEPNSNTVGNKKNTSSAASPAAGRSAACTNEVTLMRRPLTRSHASFLMEWLVLAARTVEDVLASHTLSSASTASAAGTAASVGPRSNHQRGLAGLSTALPSSGGDTTSTVKLPNATTADAVFAASCLDRLFLASQMISALQRYACSSLKFAREAEANAFLSGGGSGGGAPRARGGATKYSHSNERYNKSSSFATSGDPFDIDRREVEGDDGNDLTGDDALVSPTEAANSASALLRVLEMSMAICCSPSESSSSSSTGDTTNNTNITKKSTISDPRVNLVELWHILDDGRQQQQQQRQNERGSSSPITAENNASTSMLSLRRGQGDYHLRGGSSTPSLVADDAGMTLKWLAEAQSHLLLFGSSSSFSKAQLSKGVQERNHIVGETTHSSSSTFLPSSVATADPLYLRACYALHREIMCDEEANPMPLPSYMEDEKGAANVDGAAILSLTREWLGSSWLSTNVVTLRRLQQQETPQIREDPYKQEKHRAPIRIISLEELATHAYFRDRAILPNTRLGSAACNVEALTSSFTTMNSSNNNNNHNNTNNKLSTASQPFLLSERAQSDANGVVGLAAPTFASSTNVHHTASSLSAGNAHRDSRRLHSHSRENEKATSNAYAGEEATAAKARAEAYRIQSDEKVAHQLVVGALIEHSITCRAEEREALRLRGETTAHGGEGGGRRSKADQIATNNHTNESAEELDGSTLSNHKNTNSATAMIGAEKGHRRRRSLVATPSSRSLHQYQQPVAGQQLDALLPQHQRGGGSSSSSHRQSVSSSNAIAAAGTQRATGLLSSTEESTGGSSGGNNNKQQQQQNQSEAAAASALSATATLLKTSNASRRIKALLRTHTRCFGERGSRSAADGSSIVFYRYRIAKWSAAAKLKEVPTAAAAVTQKTLSTTAMAARDQNEGNVNNNLNNNRGLLPPIVGKPGSAATTPAKGGGDMDAVRGGETGATPPCSPSSPSLRSGASSRKQSSKSILSRKGNNRTTSFYSTSTSGGRGGGGGGRDSLSSSFSLGGGGGGGGSGGNGGGLNGVAALACEAAGDDAMFSSSVEALQATIRNLKAIHDNVSDDSNSSSGSEWDEYDEERGVGEEEGDEHHNVAGSRKEGKKNDDTTIRKTSRSASTALLLDDDHEIAAAIVGAKTKRDSLGRRLSLSAVLTSNNNNNNNNGIVVGGNRLPSSSAAHRRSSSVVAGRATAFPSSPSAKKNTNNNNTDSRERAARKLYKRRRWQDALVRLFLGPSTSGTHYSFYPTQRVPLLGSFVRRKRLRGGEEVDEYTLVASGGGSGVAVVGNYLPSSAASGGERSGDSLSAPQNTILVALRTRKELLERTTATTTITQTTSGDSERTLPPPSAGAAVRGLGLRGTPPSSALLSPLLPPIAASAVSKKNDVSAGDVNTTQKQEQQQQQRVDESCQTLMIGTAVREEHWVSFMGIVFNLSVRKGEGRRRRGGGGGGMASPPSTQANAAVTSNYSFGEGGATQRSSIGGSAAEDEGRRLYFSFLFTPCFSGRDVTVLLAHRLSGIDGFDFGVPRAMLLASKAPLRPQKEKAGGVSSLLSAGNTGNDRRARNHNDDEDARRRGEATNASDTHHHQQRTQRKKGRGRDIFSLADPFGEAKADVEALGANSILSRVSPAVKRELFAILALLLHDYPIVGVLHNGLRFMAPLISEY